MNEQASLFPRELGSLCHGCPFFIPCGAARSEFACAPAWGADTEGGEEILLPGFEATNDFLEAVGGPQFDSPALPVSVPDLPRFIPAVKPIKALAGRLQESIYAVNAETVIGTREEPLTANQIRSPLRLSREQKIVFLLFGHDDFIERLWNESEVLLPLLARSGFDLVVAPSYSTYLPRPRPEFLYAAKRSLVMFQALQILGVPVIPRVAWVIEYDALRFADWVNRVASVTTVGIDWSSKSKNEWARQIKGLRVFDRATGKRLRYLIHGPSTPDRLRNLVELIEPHRLSLTGHLLAKPPRAGNDVVRLLPKKAEIFFMECARRRADIDSAIKATQQKGSRSFPRPSQSSEEAA